MTGSTFPAWVFDNSPIDDPKGFGQDAVDFLRALKHPKSSAPGRRFQLYPPFERMTRRIYGPLDANGKRTVKTVFLMMGRGNRKTSHAAAWSLLHLIGPEALPGGQAIFAAYDRTQAGIGFREAVDIIRQDRRLMATTRIYNAKSPNSAKQIVNVRNGATLTVVSSDGAAQNGTTPAFVLIDEIHVWKDRELWETLDSGKVKVVEQNPLTIICTTAGRGQDGVGYELYEKALKVASGEIIDPTFLPILFQAEPGDDWEDEAVWEKANPGLPYGFINTDVLREQAEAAKTSPPARYQFQQYNLNIWMSASRDPLFDMENFDAGKVSGFDISELEHLQCFIGVDASRSGDLTAIVAAWRHPDGTISAYPWFYLPSEGLAEKARLEDLPYIQWQEEGFLDVIEGRTIEPGVIADKIIELCATYDVQEVVFDPSLAGPIIEKLMEHGINVLQQPQTNKAMHGPICDLERTVNGRRLRHSGHPILRHHLDSVVVKRSTGTSGLVTMHKGTRHTNHIDGAVAAAIAISRAAQGPKPLSPWADPDFDISKFVGA